MKRKMCMYRARVAVIDKLALELVFLRRGALGVSATGLYPIPPQYERAVF